MNNIETNIQNIESNLFNILNKIGTLNMQNNNPMLYAELNRDPWKINPIGEQLIDLSKKILSIGIKAFIEGNNLTSLSSRYTDYDFDELRDIASQLNNLVNLKNIEKEQRYIYKNQILMEVEKNFQINVHFGFPNGFKKNLFVYPDITIQQLYNKFLEAIRYEFLIPNPDYNLYGNGRLIDLNDQTRVRDYFNIINNNIYIYVFLKRF